jgi:hypothetical protein
MSKCPRRIKNLLHFDYSTMRPSRHLRNVVNKLSAIRRHIPEERIPRNKKKTGSKKVQKVTEEGEGEIRYDGNEEEWNLHYVSLDSCIYPSQWVSSTIHWKQCGVNPLPLLGGLPALFTNMWRDSHQDELPLWQTDTHGLHDADTSLWLVRDEVLSCVTCRDLNDSNDARDHPIRHKNTGWFRRNASS